MLKKFVEIFSTKPPQTAREFAGYPIRMELKEISPAEDDRIMADGRPAYAWWNEIQMLRQRDTELRKQQMEMREQMVVLRIAQWAVAREMLSDDTLLRIKRVPIDHRDPVLELLRHPEKYVSVAESRGEGK